VKHRSDSKRARMSTNSTFTNPLLEHFIPSQSVDRDNRGLSVNTDDSSLHRAPDMLRGSGEEEYPLHEDSVMIAQGAIIASKKRLQAITQKEFFTIYSKEEVTLNWLEAMGRCGFSRILVRDTLTKRLSGYIVVKELMRDLKKYLNYLYVNATEVSGSKAAPYLVGDLTVYQLLYFDEDATVLDALNSMQAGYSRIGVLTKDGSPDATILGYFSMEDVVEEIIQEEIEDEKDVSPRSKLTRVPSAPFLPLQRTNTSKAINLLKEERTKSIDSGRFSV